MARSPFYGENEVRLRLRSLDLLWKPLGTVVRIILDDHPTRGGCIQMTTVLSFEPLDVIGLDGLRLEVEVGFKQVVRTRQTCADDFWRRDMKLLRPLNHNRYLHGQSQPYRHRVQRKRNADHGSVHAGLIAEGVLQDLGSACSGLVSTS